jgi:hypothetical protein
MLDWNKFHFGQNSDSLNSIAYGNTFLLRTMTFMIEIDKTTTKIGFNFHRLFSIFFSGGCPVVDACTSLTSGDCPIEAGETIVYNIEMFIDTTFPAVIHFYKLRLS